MMEGSLLLARMPYAHLIYDVYFPANLTVVGNRVYRQATVMFSRENVIEDDLPVAILGLPSNPPAVRFPYPHNRRVSPMISTTLTIN